MQNCTLIVLLDTKAKVLSNQARLHVQFFIFQCFIVSGGGNVQEYDDRSLCGVRYMRSIQMYNMIKLKYKKIKLKCEFIKLKCELFKSMCDLYQFNLKTLNDVTFNSIISYIIYILYYTLCILYALSMKRFKSIQSINKQSLNGEITERSLFICKSNGIERS